MKTNKNFNKSLKLMLTLILTLALILTTVVPAEAASNKPSQVQTIFAVRNNAGNKITVKFDKFNKAAGYQVAYKTATAKKYTVKKTKKASFTFKAKTNKAYKIKVRAYNKKSGKTCYGAWSNVITVSKTVSSTCQHNWVTITDYPAWDEPVYDYVWTGTTSWPDGTDCPHGCGENYNWCGLHCKRCRPNCPDPDPRGYCAQYDQIMVFEEVQVDTVHHPAVTHEECTKCHQTK
ncbi:MAG: hypothetical protein NC124_03515 [Clostridium sp.]|nr:hypothetical protein [Clostridium sp.]